MDLISKPRNWLSVFALVPLSEILKPRDVLRASSTCLSRYYLFIYLTNASEHLLGSRHSSWQKFLPTWCLRSSDFTILTTYSLKNKMFFVYFISFFYIKKTQWITLSWAFMLNNWCCFQQVLSLTNMIILFSDNTSHKVWKRKEISTGYHKENEKKIGKFPKDLECCRAIGTTRTQENWR